MSSAFKDGVDAGLSDFKSFNSDLGSVSLSTDPDGFATVADIAGRGPDSISRMRSGFERIGENLTGDQKSWADGRKGELLGRCDALVAQCTTLASNANDGRDAASKLKDLTDAAGSDPTDDQKSQISDATDQLTSATSTVTQQIGVVQGQATAFFDLLRDINTGFQNAIAQAKSTVDSGQSPVDQALNDIRGLTDQATTKQAEGRDLVGQMDALSQRLKDLYSVLGGKEQAEKAADQALIDGSKKDPPLSASDLQSLEQASASARQDRERAEADCFTQASAVYKANGAVMAKNDELTPLIQQLSAAKQRRDGLMNTLNLARTALAQLNLEYEAPSL